MVEETTAATHSLSREAASLNELLALFKLSDAVPQAAVPSPARELVRRLADTFPGNAAARQQDWKEFGGKAEGGIRHARDRLEMIS